MAVLEEAGLRDLPEHFPDDVDDARRRLAAAFRSKTRVIRNSDRFLSRSIMCLRFT